jgi:uncharacterized membrane protein YgdD (TMEM256/DUF423 family)
MQPNRWITVGALLGAAGVGLGAFGAHGLEDRLAAAGWDEAQVLRRVDIFETAVRYQMFHAPAMVLVGLLGLFRRSTCLWVAGMFFLLGVLVFSGLLYVLVFAGDQWRWLGAVVPIGGASLIAGWVALAIAGCKCTSNDACSAKNQPSVDA